MPDQALPRLRRPPSAREMNRIFAALRSVQRLSSSDAFGTVNQPGGRNFVFRPPPPFTAQITGGTGPYSWNYATRDGSSWFATSTGGTTTDGPAYEINGATDVPIGHIVELYPGYQGDFRFSLSRFGSSGGGGGGGSTCGSCTIPASCTLTWVSQPPTSCSICTSNGSTVIPSGSLTLTKGASDGCAIISTGCATSATPGGCEPNMSITPNPGAAVVCSGSPPAWKLEVNIDCSTGGVDIGNPISSQCSPLLIVYEPTVGVNGGSCYYQSLTVSS